MPKKTRNIKKEAIDSFVRRAGIYNSYESRPRRYGSDELLYAREVHTISVIGRRGSIDMSGIAAGLGVTNGAATRSVDKLVKKGFVIKKKNPADNRKYICRLTDKAKNIFTYHEALDNRTYSELEEKLSVFTDRQIESAMRFLSLMEDTVREWE